VADSVTWRCRRRLLLLPRLPSVPRRQLLLLRLLLPPASWRPLLLLQLLEVRMLLRCASSDGTLRA
jgi:hypothetical protein